MSKMFLIHEKSNNTKVLVNPSKIDFVVPGNEGTAEVYIGGSRLLFSTDAVTAVFRDLDIDLISVEEPQIAGVSDEDIVDDSEPTAFEDIVDANEVDRSEDIVVEDTADLEATEGYVEQE